MADMDDCRGIARAQVEHLRRSGVLVDEIERLEADCHGLHNPHGWPWMRRGLIVCGRLRIAGTEFQPRGKRCIEDRIHSDRPQGNESFSCRSPPLRIRRHIHRQHARAV
jgi:hypothetical protein